MVPGCIRAKKLARNVLSGDALKGLALAFLLCLGLYMAACSPAPNGAAGANFAGNQIPTKESAGRVTRSLWELSDEPEMTHSPEAESGSPSLSSTQPSIPTLAPSPGRTQAFSPSPTSELCLTRGGRTQSGLQVNTDLVSLPLELRVYTPPCYAELTDRRYPVIYLIHGQSYNDDQWDRLGIDETADRLIASGAISPVIIVMPRDRVWTQPTEDAFGQAVAEALLPWIDEAYRTIPEREFRAVGGLSRGAGWALHLGFSRWESFGVIGMHSLPVFWTDLPHIRTWLNAIPAEQLPRIYIDAPDKDRPQIAKSAAWFEGLLTELSVPHEWHLFTGYHDEAYWGSHVEDYLRWYTQNW
jgi:enterochelin esterase-like enzyme